MKTYSRKIRNIERGTRKSVTSGLVLLDSSSNIGHNILTTGFMASGSEYPLANGCATVKENLLPGKKNSSTRSVFQTPFPVEGSDIGVFKLGTSRPLPVSPNHGFSPVPLVKPSASAPLAPQVNGIHVKSSLRLSRNGTTSRRLKENMRPKLPKTAHTSVSEALGALRLPLASPFTSRPSSPIVQAVPELEHEPHLFPRPGHRASLSNFHSAPETESTSLGQENKKISPVTVANIQRRPSAPSLRYRVLPSLEPSAQLNIKVPVETRETNGRNSLKSGVSLTVDRLPSYEFLCGSETYFTSSLDGTVDFNRPPSQMSLYGGDMDSDSSNGGLFTHIQGRSTPRFLHSVLSRVLHNGESPKNQAQNDVEPVKLSEKKQYSPWISDSIISPPSYFKQQKNHDMSMVEHSSEDMDLTLPISPLDAASGDVSALEWSERGPEDSVSGESSEGSSLKLRKTGPLIIDFIASMDNYKSVASSTDSESEGKSSIQIPVVSSQTKSIPGFSRTRSGTIVQSKMGGRLVDRRTRSGTITQDGGSTRRTRSGTIVQTTKESRRGLAGELRNSQNLYEVRSPGGSKSQDEICSCRSSDDELMLRSHSHHDLDVEDLEWKVADPPSPVVKRLRKFRRKSAFRRQRIRGRNSNHGINSMVVDGDECEDGIDGDIEDDELDFLGNFMPKNR